MEEKHKTTFELLGDFALNTERVKEIIEEYSS